jgi:hypothetical protein
LLQKLANRVTVFDHGDEFTMRQPDDTLDILSERLVAGISLFGGT